MLFTCHFSIFLKYKELFYETGTLFHPRRVDIQVIMAYTHRRSHLVLLKLYAPRTKYIWVFVNNQYLRNVHSLVII